MPVAYADSVFSIYSEDFGQVGLHYIEVEAYLADYDSIRSEKMTFEIEILDVCENPIGLSVIQDY